MTGKTPTSAASPPRTSRLACAAAALALGLAAPASGLAQTLTIGVGAAVTSIDPHYHNLAPNLSMGMHIFDRLVERDARARTYPGLAESWTALSETVWEFRLRRGVKWHDGRDFTADDVVFTLERAPRVPNSPGGFGTFTRAIARAEVVDPHTIRLHTHRPHPLLPNDLASVSIIARHAAEGAATEDYNSGRAAIGTGPYRLVAYLSGERVDLVRNDAYWGEREPWARVNYRWILNDGARTAAIWPATWTSSTRCRPATAPACSAIRGSPSPRSRRCATSSFRRTTRARARIRRSPTTPARRCRATPSVMCVSAAPSRWRSTARRWLSG